MTNEQFEAFLIDTRLSELLELQRTGNEALDVIKSLEIQHSRFLAWMFDSREGHGQGEEILRDLLLHAATKAKILDQSALLKGSTKGFFNKNPPAKLHAMSLGSAYVIREMRISKESQIDLFIVDDQNKLLLIIENKAGKKVDDSQLRRYRNELISGPFRNHARQGWDLVFLCLDKYEDGTLLEPKSTGDGYWLLLGYSWLKSTARRAEMQVERGNRTASLVAAYCNRQLDEWESPVEARSRILCADLFIAHRDVVDALARVRPRVAALNWLKPTSSRSLELFALQHRGALQQLRNMDTFSALEVKVKRAIPSLSADSFWADKTSLDIYPSGWATIRKLDSEGESWPALLLRVVRSSAAGGSFTLTAVWFHDYAEENADALAFVLCDAFGDGGPAWRGNYKVANGEYLDSFDMGSNLTPDRLVELIKVWEYRLSSAFAEAAIPG